MMERTTRSEVSPASKVIGVLTFLVGVILAESSPVKSFNAMLAVSTAKDFSDRLQGLTSGLRALLEVAFARALSQPRRQAYSPEPTCLTDFS